MWSLGAGQQGTGSKQDQPIIVAPTMRAAMVVGRPALPAMGQAAAIVYRYYSLDPWGK